MPPGMVLIALRGSNYPCLEQIFMVPKGVRAIEVRLYIKSILAHMGNRL